MQMLFETSPELQFIQININNSGFGSTDSKSNQVFLEKRWVLHRNIPGYYM